MPKRNTVSHFSPKSIRGIDCCCCFSLLRCYQSPIYYYFYYLRTKEFPGCSNTYLYNHWTLMRPSDWFPPPGHKLETTITTEQSSSLTQKTRTDRMNFSNLEVLWHTLFLQQFNSKESGGIVNCVRSELFRRYGQGTTQEDRRLDPCGRQGKSNTCILQG